MSQGAEGYHENQQSMRVTTRTNSRRLCMSVLQSGWLGRFGKSGVHLTHSSRLSRRIFASYTIGSFSLSPPFDSPLSRSTPFPAVASGTIKDAVTRYAHQSGHHVSRRAGWDCHGLPVEYEIDQSLGIKHRDQVFV